MSVSTARSYYYNIKTFFVYLEEYGIIPNGRTDRILPRTLLQSMSPERRTPPAPIPDSTIQIILQTSKELAPELYPILVVAAQCGLRTSEMIHLSTEDLFFEEGKWYLTVKREIQKRKKENEELFYLIRLALCSKTTELHMKLQFFVTANIDFFNL